MEKKVVERFEKLHIQIKDMYSELSVLSKKSPDGAINKFKLNFINQLIEEANRECPKVCVNLQTDVR